MNLMVPTFMAKCMSANDFQGKHGTIKQGDIFDIAYGQGLVLKAMGIASGFVDEDATHMKAQEELEMYGGDCWFPQNCQTIGRVADYLAQAGLKTATVN